MIKSISTFGLLNQRNANLRALEADFARTSEELSSGKKSDLAAQIREETPTLFSLREKVGENTAFLQSISTFERRSEVMSASLTNIDSALNSVIETAVLNVPEATDSIASLGLSAHIAIDQVIDALNSNFDGRYLFAGVDIDTPPLHRADELSVVSGLSPNDVFADILDGSAYAPVQPPAFGAFTALEAADAIARFDGVFDGTNVSLPAPTNDYSFERSIYDGSLGSPLPSIRISDGTPIKYGMTGEDGAIRSTLQGLYMLASVDLTQMAGTDAFEPYVTEALNRLTNGQDAIRANQASLGATQIAVSEHKVTYNTQNTILNININAYELSDPIETQSRFAEIEKQLDAAYAATVRASSLRLTKYL